MTSTLRVDPVQRRQGGLYKLFSVHQERPLCSSGISIPRKEQRRKTLAVATGYPGERRQRVKDGDALNGLRPEKECFTLSLGEDAVENGEHFLRDRTYVTTFAGFIATAQADTVSGTRFHHADPSETLRAGFLATGHPIYLLAAAADDFGGTLLTDPA
jgi:hypothetical protein